MAVNIVELFCPRCGKSLSVEEGRKQFFCSYCGSQLMMDNDHEYTYHYVDEAEIKKAETERILQATRLKLEEKEYKGYKKNKLYGFFGSLLILLIGVMAIIYDSNNRSSLQGALAFVGFFTALFGLGVAITCIETLIYGEKITAYAPGKIKVPDAVGNYKKRRYSVVKEMFTNAGFTNVKCTAINAPKRLLKNADEELVDSIEINGTKTESFTKTYYRPDATIVIYYFCKKDKTE